MNLWIIVTHSPVPIMHPYQNFGNKNIIVLILTCSIGHAIELQLPEEEGEKKEAGASSLVAESTVLYCTKNIHRELH